MGTPNITEPSEIGDWARISVLGSGSFGVVSLWRCRVTNDSIAVKKCKFHCDSSLKPKHVERWCNEVQIMKELDHPNIVKYKMLDPILEKELMKWNYSKLPLLSMEYCQKGNLRYILTQPYNMCGLEEDRVRDILLDISSAINYLHSNKITHRDIKPENIVLQDCPTKPDKVIYKLIDLGYAKELGDSTISFVGTLAYLAPEIMAHTKYTCTVDYWSFGVVAFEVICGILPFMSRLTPTDRYQLARDKKPDEICVFLNRMGNHEFSSEIFEENRISGCLKNLMEIWLRKALHFDPNKRAEPFPDSKSFFDQLNHILKKKILNVFVVYKYKFYSYEFDECTRLSTVREWIARDTGILQEEQLLLGSFQFGDCNDQTLIANCFIDENYKLFLFKRAALFGVDEHFYPKAVKQMFKKASELFSWQELKRIYSHCIHYIQRDIILASAFSEAINLYLKQLTMLFNKILKSSAVSRKKLIKLTEKVKEFNNKIKDENFCCSQGGIQLKLNRLFKSIEESIKVEHEQAKHIRKLQTKLEAMRGANLAVDIIKLPQLKELLDKAVLCFQKTVGNLGRNNENLPYGEMFPIVSKVIKIKDTLCREKNLELFSRHLRKSADVLDSLSTWMVSFDAHLTTLDKRFDEVMLVVGDDQLGASTSNKPCAIRKPSVIDSDVDQTELLNSRFTEVITDSISTYRNILEEIDSYIEDISSLL